MELQGKTVLITGATSGLGLALAQRFLAEGAQVTGVGRRADPGLTHPNYSYAAGDITDYDAARRAVQACVERFGKLDILVNCAGVCTIGSVFDTSPEEFRRHFEVNVFGLFHVTKAAMPHLMEQPGSAVVNVGSELGTKAIPERIAYGPSKAAVEMLTRCLAAECGPRVRVNGVLPGLMETPMTKDRFREAEDPDEARAAAAGRYVLGRLCRVEDVVEAILFLSTEKSSFITGDMIAVCGGGQFITCH